MVWLRTHPAIWFQNQGSFWVGLANERRRYIVTSSLIGGARTQNEPWESLCTHHTPTHDDIWRHGTWPTFVQVITYVLLDGTQRLPELILMSDSWDAIAISRQCNVQETNHFILFQICPFRIAVKFSKGHCLRLWLLQAQHKWNKTIMVYIVPTHRLMI